ncbi:MAG: LL-diaminopimelate aminotransferase [Desulfovibrionaceae bacterium]|nr:LL-diaminopimelate aminotransferase [Desulfovibrionaceae bacterium]
MNERTSFVPADRVAALPPYLFAGIDRARAEAEARGLDIISLGIGDPDTPTPDFIIEALRGAAGRPDNHRYPSYEGMPAFRRAVADWYAARFGVDDLDPDREILCTIGSKEAIGHFPFAWVNPGDLVLVPSPGYPVYAIAARFAGAEVLPLPLTEENGFLPNLDAIDEAVWDRAKIIWLNSPNNPTGSMASLDFYGRLVSLCRRHHVILAHDSAYSEIYYDDADKPLSVFSVPGARDVAIEFQSLSKTYNMTGWRVGMAVGNAELVRGLGVIKENMDSGTFQAVQEAAMAALRGGDAFCRELRRMYRGRRDTVCAALRRFGLRFYEPRGALYVWARVPDGFTSESFVSRVLNETGVVLTPGTGFGAAGEGWFRISLTVPTARLEEAMSRLARVQAMNGAAGAGGVL